MPDKTSSAPARFSYFLNLCRQLKECAAITNPAAREAAISSILFQLIPVIDKMANPERADAARHLWATSLDVPPFERVFDLLTPSKFTLGKAAPKG